MKKNQKVNTEHKSNSIHLMNNCCFLFMRSQKINLFCFLSILIVAIIINKSINYYDILSFEKLKSILNMPTLAITLVQVLTFALGVLNYQKSIRKNDCNILNTVIRLIMGKKYYRRSYTSMFFSLFVSAILLILIWCYKQMLVDSLTPDNIQQQIFIEAEKYFKALVILCIVFIYFIINSVLYIFVLLPKNINNYYDYFKKIAKKSFAKKYTYINEDYIDKLVHTSFSETHDNIEVEKLSCFLCELFVEYRELNHPEILFILSKSILSQVEIKISKESKQDFIPSLIGLIIKDQTITNSQKIEINISLIFNYLLKYDMHSIQDSDLLDVIINYYPLIYLLLDNHYYYNIMDEEQFNILNEQYLEYIILNDYEIYYESDVCKSLDYFFKYKYYNSGGKFDAEFILYKKLFHDKITYDYFVWKYIITNTDK